MSPRGRTRRIILIALAFPILALATAARADTYTVVNTNDLGAGSLRQAILDANAHGGIDTIAFAIPGGGVHTIAVPVSGLPTITSPVVIDGTTQPGYAGTPLIEISGSQTNGLTITAGGSTVRGLVLNHFAVAIGFQSAGGNLVEGCYIGTDATGTADASAGEGIRILSSNGNTIGGASPASRNLISGNDSVGIEIESSNGTIVQGNLIGTDVTGRAALPNGSGITIFGDATTVGGGEAGAGNVVSGNLGSGIAISDGTGLVIQGNFIGTDVTGTKALGNAMGINDSGGVSVTIGGTNAGEGNLVSGNAGYGMYLYNGAADTTVFGNRIGTDVTGTLPLGNITGIASSNSNTGIQIGGTGPGEANLIAFNTGYLSYSLPVGTLIYAGSERITMRGNSFHDNEALGISFNGGGAPTPNDPGDVDSGPNDKQNFPILRSVVHAASSTEVLGKLDSAPSTTYTLDFYANPACTRFPRSFDEGETWLGSSVVTTDASGHHEFDVTLPVATVDGARIAATATDPLGNTSEFSQRIIFSMNPSSGPAEGGRPLTINGTDFSNPTSITIGGVDAPQTFISDHQLYTFSPVLPPGTVNDVVVTTADATTGRLVYGWVADFLDVPESQQFHSFVTTLVSNAITVGVGGGNYGVDQPTLRRQMAVFLLKARHGLCYVPPPCAGMFPDVPCPSTFAAWIEALAAEGITGGCGGGNYCPTLPVRRDQMAVFLLKAEHGPDYVPPPCAGIYGDVACPSTFANWIEQLNAEGITGGCGGGNYCPGNANTRGQMAVFIVKTFRLS